MAKTFEGCVAAREISLTRKAANPHAVALVLKNVAGAAPSQPEPEKTEMATDAEITKAATVMAAAIVAKTALWTDTTKAYFAGLTADKHEAFMAKTAADQNAEAVEAAKAAETAAIEKKALEEGKTAREVALEKRLNSQDEVIKGLQTRLADSDVEKRADSEFAGYPGGSKIVVPLLKSFAKLSDDERAAAEAGLKATIDLAKGSTRRFSGSGAPSEDVSKAASAQRRLDDAAKAYAKEHSVSESDAFVAITEMQAHAADVELANG